MSSVSASLVFPSSSEGANSSLSQKRSRRSNPTSTTNAAVARLLFLLPPPVALGRVVLPSTSLPKSRLVCRPIVGEYGGQGEPGGDRYEEENIWEGLPHAPLLGDERWGFSVQSESVEEEEREGMA